MPITFDYSQFERWANLIISGEVSREIANTGIKMIHETVLDDVPIRDGYILNALATKTEAIKFGDKWVAGIGRKDLVGSPSDKAPENTIWQFKEWYWNNKKK